MKSILQFIEFFAILINIPKQGNLRSFYDCVYLVYDYWKYNMESLPSEINTVIENFFDTTYYTLLKILKKFKLEVEIKIKDLELEKEYCVINMTDSTFILKQIEKNKSLLTSINTLLDLAFPTTEKILVILYNDLDAELSEQIMKNLFIKSGPDLVKELRKLHKEYSVRSFIYKAKNTISNVITIVRAVFKAA